MGIFFNLDFLGRLFFISGGLASPYSKHVPEINFLKNQPFCRKWQQFPAFLLGGDFFLIIILVFLPVPSSIAVHEKASRILFEPGRDREF
jgi:hypothetical protein